MDDATKPSEPLPKAELWPAYGWTCNDCGWDNVVGQIIRQLTPADDNGCAMFVARIARRQSPAPTAARNSTPMPADANP